MNRLLISIASFPVISPHLEKRVHYHAGEFYLYGNKKAFMLGDASVARLTLDAVPHATEIYRKGSDLHGFRMQMYQFFVIEPGKHLWLWMANEDGEDYHVEVKPDWLEGMRPIIEAALAQAELFPFDVHTFFENESGALACRTSAVRYSS